MGENFLHNLPEESAEDLYENAPCGYISFLPDGTIFRINKTLVQLLEYDEKEEIIQVKKIQDLFRIGGKIYFETHFFPLVKMQGFVKEINFDLLRKDQSYFPALLNVNQVTSEDSGSRTYRASVLDITDRSKYEKALLEGKKKAEEVSRAKAEFLSTISHEIRTPLNAIVGIGNLIQKTSLNDLQKEYARILQLSSANLLELVNNLLDLSKLEADKVKLEERSFSLTDILEVLLHSFRIRAREKKIELKSDLPQNLPNHLLGDPVKLNQILTNLLGNAIKFTKEGYVKLDIEELERSDEIVQLQFTVSDTGIGIARDKLNMIFHEFSQASYDVNLEYGGTGLGLTISQKLLQMHGSELRVTSEEGKGSEFSFTLDFKLSGEVSPSRSKRSDFTEILKASGARVLIVDDNPVNLFITSQYMQEWGLAHETVDSGEAALKAVKENFYEIILMDLHMPKMNGYEASSAIRELYREPPPVIIALSASGRGDVNYKMKKAGINAYVSKPFDPVDLQEVMAHSISGKPDNFDKNIPAFRSKKNISASLGKAVEINPAPMSVEKYLQLSSGNPAVFEKLIRNSLQSMKKLRKDFSTAQFNGKGKKLGQLIHKNTMTLHYLETHRLNQLLEEYQELLADGKSRKSITKTKAAITEELSGVISSLEEIKPKDLL